MTRIYEGSLQRRSGKPKETPVAEQTPKMGGITVEGRGRILSNIKPDGSPYMINNFPLIVRKIKKNIAVIGIIVGTGELFEERILWENNEPKIFTTNSGKELLYIVRDDNMITLSNPYLQIKSPKLPYPLITIEQGKLKHKYIVIEGNSDGFYKCYCSETLRTVILYKKGEEFIPLEFEGINEEQEDETFRNLKRMPTKDEMFLVGDKLMIWNRYQSRFEILVMGGVVFEGVLALCDGNYKIKIGSREIKFSPCIGDKREPAGKIINGTFLLSKNVPCENGRNADVVIIDSKEYVLNPISRFTIGGIQYYEVFELDMTRDERNGETVKYHKRLFTNGKKCYDFIVGKDGQVQTYKYEGISYPILNDSSKFGLAVYEYLEDNRDSRGRTILLTENGIQKIAYLIKNHWQNKTESEIKSKDGLPKKPEYTKLNFTPEQEKMPVIFINITNGIVCLGGDGENNTSRYQYHRMNPDGTLTLLYIGNNGFSITDKEDVKFWVGNNHVWCQLVRRPNTTSIFEPIIINGYEYVVAEKLEKPGEYFYVSIKLDEQQSTSIRIEDEIDINKETFMPNKSFKFEDEILYYNEDGKIKIGESYYYLSNESGEKVLDPKQSFYKVGGDTLLLLKTRFDAYNKHKIHAYIQGGMPDKHSLPCVSYKDINTGKNTGIKTVTINGYKYICTKCHASEKLLFVYVISSLGFRRCIVNMKDSEGEEFEGEEFILEGCRRVNIIRRTSDEYLEDDEGTFYYRANLDKHLVKIELPKGAEFNSILGHGIYCKTQIDRDGTELLTQEGKLVPVQEEVYRDYYRLTDGDQECKINGRKYDIIQAWDQKNNRLVSFIKTGKEYRLFKIGDCSIFMNHYENTFVLYRGSYCNPETWIDAEDMNNLVVANIGSLDSQSIGIVKETGNNNKRFGTIYSLKDGKYYVCSLYRIGSKLVAINLVDYHYGAQIDSSGIITIGGLPCNKEQLDYIYEELRPKIEPKVGKLAKKVARKVTDIHEG